MKKNVKLFMQGTFCIVILVFASCQDKKTNMSVEESSLSISGNTEYYGFKSQVEWGEHLVLIGGCHDCHTPKKMTSHGPVLDTALWLAGHPANMPRIEIDRKEVEAKGLAVAMDLTEWVGPWGISFSANLTPDPTGIGNWTEEQFIYSLRNGTAKGIPGSRPILPPMPWEMIRHMTDDEMKAVFAYLKSIKPVNNIVPAPVPPVGITN
jgi:mono/diheme cytochrome c family protein